MNLNRKVPIDKKGLAKECPKCSGTDLCIDNVEGMECMTCGCWFSIDEKGNVEWARYSRPQEIE